MPRRRELHDPFFKKAKAEGYVARSAYKLLEIQERYGLIRAGDCVLDLGCAPGSWLQVASELVGPRGMVFGIDLSPVTIGRLPNVRTVVGDAFKVDGSALLESAGAPGLFDVVLSDMAPSTTGTPTADHFRSVALCRRVLELLPSVLSPGGGLAMKVFEGEVYPELLRECEGVMAACKGLRPKATREVSREIFIVGRGFVPRAEPGPGGGPRGLAPRTKPKGWGA